MGETQYGLPLIVGNFADYTAQGLTRIRLEKAKTGGYDERWLQKLVSRYPSLLPIEQIEPALTPAIPVCMELPLRSGYVDNVYATPDGDLIIGETKLFRNPEARREVIGQIIDYAKDLSRLSYEELNAAILRAEAPDGNGGRPSDGLYGAIASSTGEDLIEEQFIDAVSRNLERGRFLLIVIGDGIQLGTESITAFLQQHAGMHFTLGLVELALFELPPAIGGYLVQPRILARTRNIDRGIVTIDNGKIIAKPPSDQPATATTSKRTSISEERFYEELAKNAPTVGLRLKEFIFRLEPLGISTDFGKASLNLRWRPDDKRAWNLGCIQTSGKVWTEVASWQADTAGLLNLSHSYLQRLASMVPGADVKQSGRPNSWYVVKGGTYITIDDLLAHADGWRAAIEEFTAAVTEALRSQ